MQNQGGLQQLHMRKSVLFPASNEALVLAQQRAVNELAMLQSLVNAPIKPSKLPGILRIRWMGLFHIVLQRFGDLGNVAVRAEQTLRHSTAQPGPPFSLEHLQSKYC